MTRRCCIYLLYKWNNK